MKAIGSEFYRGGGAGRLAPKPRRKAPTPPNHPDLTGYSGVSSPPRRDPDWLSWFFLSFGATTGLIAVGYLALWAAFGWG